MAAVRNGPRPRPRSVDEREHLADDGAPECLVRVVPAVAQDDDARAIPEEHVVAPQEDRSRTADAVALLQTPLEAEHRMAGAAAAEARSAVVADGIPDEIVVAEDDRPAAVPQDEPVAIPIPALHTDAVPIALPHADAIVVVV